MHYEASINFKLANKFSKELKLFFTHQSQLQSLDYRP